MLWHKISIRLTSHSHLDPAILFSQGSRTCFPVPVSHKPWSLSQRITELTCSLPPPICESSLAAEDLRGRTILADVAVDGCTVFLSLQIESLLCSSFPSLVMHRPRHVRSDVLSMPRNPVSRVWSPRLCLGLYTKLEYQLHIHDFKTHQLLRRNLGRPIILFRQQI